MPFGPPRKPQSIRDFLETFDKQHREKTGANPNSKPVIFSPEEKQHIQEEAKRHSLSRQTGELDSGLYNVRRDGSETVGPIDRGFSLLGWLGLKKRK